MPNLLRKLKTLPPGVSAEIAPTTGPTIPEKSEKSPNEKPRSSTIIFFSER